MLKNNAPFNFNELTASLKGADFYNIDSHFSAAGVSVDTRTIEPGNIFIALSGEKIDGHSRVGDAFEKGASAVIVEKSKISFVSNYIENKSVIAVDSTLEALGALGKYHRKRFNIPVIAIGGSNGKTTTKEMIATVLSRKLKLLKTHENFNNQLGTPLMLLQLSDDYEAAAIEIGTNEPGEIAILSEMVAPTHGIITNIGKEHLEKLIDLDGVELEETYLFGYLLKKAGFAFINSDDDRLKRYNIALNNKMNYGTSDDLEFYANISFDNLLHPILNCVYDDNEFVIKLQTTGKASALNAIAAAAVGTHFGVPRKEIIAALESFEPVAGHGYARTAVEKIGNMLVINDCYNANPSSMRMALDTLSEYNTKGKKIAVLGDMRELGESSFEEHIDILRFASDCAEFVLVTGKEMEKAYKHIENKRNVRYFETKEVIASCLYDFNESGNIMLLKGSRGMKMETVIDLLKSK